MRTQRLHCPAQLPFSSSLNHIFILIRVSLPPRETGPITFQHHYRSPPSPPTLPRCLFHTGFFSLSPTLHALERSTEYFLVACWVPTLAPSSPPRCPALSIFLQHVRLAPNMSLVCLFCLLPVSVSPARQRPAPGAPGRADLSLASTSPCPLDRPQGRPKALQSKHAAGAALGQ